MMIIIIITMISNHNLYFYLLYACKEFITITAISYLESWMEHRRAEISYRKIGIFRSLHSFPLILLALLVIDLRRKLDHAFYDS